MFIHLPFLLLLLHHLHRSNEDDEEQAKMAHLVDRVTSPSWAEPVQA